jgi:hypothetical protein
MRTRWRLLFWCSLGTLIGVAWLAKSFEMSLWSWVNLQMIGLIVASGFAFGAMVKDMRVRWPAAAALVCAAPMGQGLYRVFFMLPSFVRLTGLPGLVMIAGSAGTIVIAIYILAVRPPPPPDERIPHARSAYARS